MKLIPDWKAVLGGAWSVWLMGLAALVSIADLLLRAAPEALPWLPAGWLPLISATLATLAIPARIVLQTNMSQWLTRFWADQRGAIRRGRMIAGAAVLAAASAAVPMVRGFEGQELTPYRDIVGQLTWCSGETEGQPKDSYTAAECDLMLARRLVEFSGQIALCLPADTPHQVRVAFVSAAYNIGAGAFCRSSMSRRALAGDLPGACEALLMWDKGRVNGILQRIRGLTLRRQQERALCLSGLGDAA
ncbi:lysozyme [Pseudodonghicola flavimaris]|uniref:Lysozyme n=1 Tax=Pseudodonghicola flavimaris TaxID=3050036 RepID=A0ABT7EZ42_9RHOB|nr:lysozyme [Pseudodonghicola flavimaris]MDK3017632.1 lysozyme [Pseudodonghicola flavimaris]